MNDQTYFGISCICLSISYLFLKATLFDVIIISGIFLIVGLFLLFFGIRSNHD